MNRIVVCIYWEYLKVMFKNPHLWFSALLAILDATQEERYAEEAFQVGPGDPRKCFRWKQRDATRKLEREKKGWFQWLANWENPYRWREQDPID